MTIEESETPILFQKNRTDAADIQEECREGLAGETEGEEGERGKEGVSERGAETGE